MKEAFIDIARFADSYYIEQAKVPMEVAETGDGFTYRNMRSDVVSVRWDPAADKVSLCDESGLSARQFADLLSGGDEDFWPDFLDGMGYSQCRLCGELTPVVVNIKFDAVPVCESCCSAVFMQQAVWYSRNHSGMRVYDPAFSSDRIRVGEKVLWHMEKNEALLTANHKSRIVEVMAVNYDDEKLPRGV